MAFSDFRAAFRRAFVDVTPNHLSNAEMREIFDVSKQTLEDVKRGAAADEERTYVEDGLIKALGALRPDRLGGPAATTDEEGYRALYHLVADSYAPAEQAKDSFLNHIEEAQSKEWPKLRPDLAPYGGEILDRPVPGFLQARISPIDHVVDFGKGKGQLGTGIHVGNGFVLTARHVCDYPESLRSAPTGAFVGKADYSAFVPGAVLRVAPEKGALPETFRFPMEYAPEQFGQHNDWALLQLPGKAAPEGAVFRRTSTMKRGEPIYTAGDNTNGLIRVSAGTLGEIVGGNARVENMLIEGGFSGSPAFDADGNVIGVVYQQDGFDGQIVTTDAILDQLEAARRQDASLPELRVASVLQPESSGDNPSAETKNQPD